MKKVAENIYSFHKENALLGFLSLNLRMTIIKLKSGGLFVHSPIPLNQNLKEEINSIGNVEIIASPNLLHHLFIGDWQEAYPEAKLFAPKGLNKKRKDLRIDFELGTEFDEKFSEEILRFELAGMPKVNESLFYHIESKTLIATDFCFYLPEALGFTSLYASMMGFKNTVKCPLLFRAGISDKSAFKNSLSALSTLEIDHLSMCHDQIISQDAQKELKAVLAQFEV